MASGVIACSGVNTQSGSTASGATGNPGSSGGQGSSTTTNVASTGAATCVGMQGGFAFGNLAGSSGQSPSGASAVPGTGGVAQTFSTWPTVPPLVSSGLAGMIPSVGGLAAAPGHISGGGFGMKLDNKPPVMHGSFDLYAVELETFLRRMNVWSVIEDEITTRASTTSAQFALMDNIARGAILHGIPTTDAELICHEASAHAMWTRFVNKQTKREYGNYIFARQMLYANKYAPEKNMNDWLREMELQRNELLHYKKVISDEEFAEIILSNVLQTHREVVRQFSKHYDPGVQRSAPSAAQVMNALRAESELDARSDEPPQTISSAQAGKRKSKQQGQRRNQQQRKGKQRGRGRYKARIDQNQNAGGSTGKPGGKSNDKEDTRECWNCHETGHLQRDCTRPKRADNESESQLPERKRWQGRNRPGNNSNDGTQRQVSMLSRQTSDSKPVVMQHAIDTTIEWVLDSASDCHVCTNEELLTNLRKDGGPAVYDWEGKASTCEGQVGEVEIRVKNEKQPRADAKLSLERVIFRPNGLNNLLSLDKLEQDGWDFTKTKKQKYAWLQKGELLLKLEKTRGRYRLRSSAIPARQVTSMTRDTERALVLWHNRLSHLNYGALQRMVRNDTVDGVEIIGDVSAPSDKCWTCIQSRMKRMSYKRVTTSRSVESYQKLMSDMCYVGEYTYDGFMHFQLVQDEATRYLWGFLMKEKAEATKVVIDHLKWLLAQRHHIQVFSTDQGKELVNKVMKAFLRANGIEFIWTNAYSPEENGLVERMNGVVMSRVRSLLTSVDMPNLLWGEAFKFAIEVMNLSPTAALAGETPYTRRFGEKPDLSNLRTWGCVVFVFTQKVLRKNKLENPGKPAIFLGYANNSISYRVLDLHSGSIQELRTAEFMEEWTVERSYVEKLMLNRYCRSKCKISAKIPYVRVGSITGPSPAMLLGTYEEEEDSEPSNKRQCTYDLRDHGSNSVDDAPNAAAGPVSSLSSANPMRSTEVDARSTRSRRTRPADTETRSSRDRGLREWHPNELHLDTDGEGGSEGGKKLSNRNCHAPSQSSGDLSNSRCSKASAQPLALSDSEKDRMHSSDDDFEEETFEEETSDAVIGNGDPMQDISRLVGGDREAEGEARNDPSASFRRSTRARRPNVRLSDYELDIPVKLVIQSVNELLEPTSVEEALKAPDARNWIEALDTEYKEQLRNHVWDLVDRPKGVKVLKTKWVFVKKRNAQGEVVRYRARITVKGCQQQFGINFWETYAPVAKIQSIRLILLLALHQGLLCRQVDFVTAFLNGPINEADIYMEQPEYFDDGSGRVCKLRQSLYGLRQAPRIWYQVLDKYLRKCGFTRTKMDAGVYVRTVGGNKVFVTVYVDDLLIVGETKDIEMVVAELKSEFKIKDLGEVKHLLGMEITYEPGRMLSISQRTYCEKILKRFKMDKCKPVPTPQVKGNLPPPGTPEEEPVCVNEDPDMDYRQIVGSLQYLAQCSRPDIANAVRTLGKYLNCFTHAHHVLAKRVLRYLRGTTDFGLVWTLSGTTDVQVDAYVNSARCSSKKEVQIIAHADADLGNEKDDRRSISGFVLQMEGCTYAYSSRKQRIITDDTCSSEFVAAAECSTMVMWTHNLFKELQIDRKKTTLYDDNQAAIAVIKANTGDYKVKGIDLKYHKIRDYYERDEFALEYCPSEDNLADILTKPLGPIQFKKLRKLLNVVPVPSAQDASAN